MNYGVLGHLKSLEILDISDNLLSSFHVDLPVSLEVLYLDGNPLSNDNIFQQRLLYIRYLSLARTRLTKPSIFSSFLPVLQYLDLQDIPALTLTTEDLKKLRHLRILYVSPRMFTGRGKSQQCREFIQGAKENKIEVKAFSCFPEGKSSIDFIQLINTEKNCSNKFRNWCWLKSVTKTLNLDFISSSLFRFRRLCPFSVVFKSTMRRRRGKFNLFIDLYSIRYWFDDMNENDNELKSKNNEHFPL